MRHYRDWVMTSKQQFRTAVKILKKDKQLKNPEDIRAIAVASVVSYALILESHVSESELLTHLYRLHHKHFQTKKRKFLVRDR